MAWKDHDSFKNRITIKGKLKFGTQFHVGTGEIQVLDARNSVLKLKDGKPYIPASSLKGVIRSEVERIANAHKKDVCDPLNPKASPQCHDFNNQDEPCIVCRMFGSQKLATHILVQDAFPSDSSVDFNFQPHVGINRKSGVKEEGALYSFETISPETSFDFEMVIENIDRDDERMEILKYVIYEMREGFLQFGGKKSTGLGMSKLVDCKVLERRREKYTDIKREKLEAFLGDRYKKKT